MVRRLTGTVLARARLHSVRIIDYARPEPLSEITLMLKEEEVRNLIGYLEQLLANPADHFHLSSEDFQTEITIARYDTPRPDLLHPETRAYM